MRGRFARTPSDNAPARKVYERLGFTHAMVALTDEGRRRARSVEDVGALMTGAASAYGRILTQFGTLVRGRTMPPRSE